MMRMTRMPASRVRVRRVVSIAIACAAALMFPPVAGAQDGAAPVDRVAGAGARSMGGAHGWLVAATRDDEGAVTARLAHAPRRDEPNADDGGVIRVARRFDRVPTHLAASDRAVFFVFAADGGGADGAEGDSTEAEGGGTAQRVYRLRAAPSGVDGLWRFEPRRGADTLPSIPSPKPLAGFAAAGGETYALVPGDDGPQLLRLRGGSWQDVPAPDGARLDRPALLSDGHRLAWVERREGGLAWSVGRVRTTGDDSDDRVDESSDESSNESSVESSVGWSSFRSSPGLGAESDDALVFTREGVAVVRFEAGVARVIAAADEGPIELGSAEIGPDPVVVPLPLERGRVMIASRPREDETGSSNVSAARAAYEIDEISLVDGRAVYSGSERGVLPVNPNEFRMLALALVALMGAALVVALRPAPDDGAVALPEGTALAEPGRRLAATALDLLLAIAIAARIFGVDVTDVIGMAVILRDDSSWLAIPLTPAIGLAIGTLAEAAFGVTLGKLISGCRVADVSRVPGAKPGFGQALVRNSIKWILPPVAMLMIGDRTGRHRGDTLAGTLVVVELERQTDGDAGEG